MAFRGCNRNPIKTYRERITVMIDSRCTERDIRRLNRYNNILKICKKQAVVLDLEAELPYSSQILRSDCRHLTDNGYLKTERLQSGKFNQFTLHYTTLIKKYDESQIIPITTTSNKSKDLRLEKIALTKVELPAHIRYIPERMVYSTKPKSPKNHVSGSTMSASIW